MRAVRADGDVFGIGAVMLAEADAFRAGAGAEGGVAALAGVADAALDIGEAGDALAGLEPALEGGADLDDFAREFVAHHAADGEGRDRMRLGHVEVGAADAAVMDLEQQLVRLGPDVVDGFDFELAVWAFEDGGAHGVFLVRCCYAREQTGARWPPQEGDWRGKHRLDILGYKAYILRSGWSRGVRRRRAGTWISLERRPARGGIFRFSFGFCHGRGVG
ncbi:MAG: hypothetical protein QM698_13675 [Micropepsaceae bacterium]